MAVPDHDQAAGRWTNRRRARAAALQALYECEVGGLTPQQALGVLHHAGQPEVDDPGESEHGFLVALVRGTIERQPEALFLRQSRLTAPSPELARLARGALASQGGAHTEPLRP